MKKSDKKDIGIVLLAAGAGSRMGMPKQLLVYEKEPLILHVLSHLKKLGLPITVVLGARAKMIRPVLKGQNIQIVENPDWEAGMGGSMQAGIRTHDDKSGVLLCVVDQPFLNAGILNNLLDQFYQASSPADALVAAQYKNGMLGVPAIFGSAWFDQLLSLPSQVGARKLIRSNEAQVLKVNFSAGDFDLDRPEDWENFRELTK